MQGAIKGPKCRTRALMAIYIENSDNHARSIGLALSMQTGLVSTTFHFKYDDQFQTGRDPYGKYIPNSLWQIKYGFSKGENKVAWIEPTKAGPIKSPSAQIIDQNEPIDTTNETGSHKEDHHDNVLQASDVLNLMI
jgi:hypothetical protein